MTRFWVLVGSFLSVLSIGTIIIVMNSLKNPQNDVIAFYSNRVDQTTMQRNDNGSLYVYDLARNQLYDLTRSSIRTDDPKWLPNGKELLIIDQQSNPIILSASGRQISQLSKTENRSFFYTLSPDQQTLLYVSERDIFGANIDGTQAQNLTNHPSNDTAPFWSPDGKHFAFVSNRRGNDEIYIMNINTQEITNITNNVSSDRSPRWSPDGKWVAFVSDRTGSGDIYITDPQGIKIRRLTTHSTIDTAPAWSPDSQRLAFVSFRQGNGEIYIIEIETQNLYNLTNHPRRDDSPTWQPIQ